MAATLRGIPREEKLEIATKLRDKLIARGEERKAAGLPPDGGYDAFAVDFNGSVTDLTPEVKGVLTAEETRTKRLTDLDDADDEVDYGYRRVEACVRIHGLRRHGPFVAAAKKLYTTAFTDGLAHLDDAIPDENRLCRKTIDVLRSADWAPVVAGIEVPQAWIQVWDDAITLSDKIYNEIADARTKRKEHVGSGQDAELDWVETATRYRKFVGSRTKRSDKALVAEAKELLAPLTDVLDKMRAAAARRETERTKAEEARKAEEAQKAGATPATPPATPAAPADPKDPKDPKGTG